MKKVLITGSNSGIGNAIKNLLSKEDYEIIELTRKVCDLKDTYHIKDKVKNIKELDVLINCAGVAYYGLHENLKPEQISEIIRVNLEAPLVLTNLLLPALIKKNGLIVNISSVTADSINTHACAYGATKAGLSSFTKSLFAEVRKHGVRCVDIKPDMTDTNLYRNANFGVSDDKEAYLNPEEVANTCLYCIKNPSITEIKLQPQKHQIKKY